MSHDLSAYQFETLGQTGDFLIRRGVSKEGSILLKVAASDEAIPLARRRFAHSLEVSRAIGDRGFVSCLDVVQHEGRPAMIMGDPGGVLLSATLGGTIEVGPRLRIAVELAAVLGSLHGLGLTHRDLKPAHVVVDVVTGRVHLTGFGLALRSPRHREAVAASGVVIGALAYLAPEQSGWMNRSTDSRSDLYSVGVMLFELFTGELPFVAHDLAEWVHCHVARRPPLAHERNPALPLVLSRIIDRLLAKEPAARYQTASGLEADLRRCLAALDRGEPPDAFVLGEHDLSSQFVITERLHGRGDESEALRQVYARAATAGLPQLALVSGASGTGKSSLVSELRAAVVASGGRFVAGKFEQLARDIPYATLTPIVRELVRQLLSEPAAALERWRGRLQEALGNSGQLVVDLVPDLGLILGSQPPVDLAPQEAQFVMQLILRRLVEAFARPERPLVLFVDDLHWADPATLGFLERLGAASEGSHLLVLLAWRDSEVDAAYLLSAWLPTARATWRHVHEVALGPLDADSTSRLVADTLHTTIAAAHPLAMVVLEKTGGNPLFTAQFLASLHEDGFIAFDAVGRRWGWELERIRARPHTANVVDLLVDKMRRLPAAAAGFLAPLACLGSAGDAATVSAITERDESEVRAMLGEAVRAGLLVSNDDAHYTFAHDRVQEAAYRLAPEAERVRLHQRAGRVLAASTPADRRGERAPEIASHLNRAAHLLTGVDERVELARWNVLAGQRARAASAHASARTYFGLARDLLPDNPWSSHTQLAFDATLGHAQAAWMVGELDAAERELAALDAAHGWDFVPRTAITHTRMSLLVAAGRYDQAVAVGLECLRAAGIELPVSPSEAEVGAEVGGFFERLSVHPVASFVDLPRLIDPSGVAVVEMLCALLTPALFSNPTLYGLVVTRAVNLSLDHGNCDASVLAYAVLGLIATTHLGQPALGRQLGEAALALVERGLGRHRGQVHVSLAFLFPFTLPLVRSTDLGALGHAESIESGNLAYASYGHCVGTTSCLLVGAALEETERLARIGLEFARHNVPLMGVLYLGQLNLVRRLRGLSVESACPAEEFVLDRVQQGDPVAGTPSFFWHTRLIQEHVLFGETAEALAIARQLGGLAWAGGIYLEMVDFQFYAALARARAHDQAGDERTEHLEALRGHRDYLAGRASLNAELFEDRALLAEAELARVEGRDWEAVALYDRAVSVARQAGHLPQEALGEELTAAFYRHKGLATPALAHLRHARRAYAAWGAAGKVRRLDEANPALVPGLAPTSTTVSVQARVEHLDLATVLRISQAVSGEIVLDRLQRRLLSIALEHAGADRAVLALAADAASEVVVEAEASLGPGGLVVEAGRPGRAVMLLSVVRYVLRTREVLVTSDARVDPRFTSEVGDEGARSVLCLPLLKQGELLGVLYLENRQIAGVFTTGRVGTLEVLASQAAISLENARLYARLEQAHAAVARSADELLATLDAIPSMVWFNDPDGGNAFQSQVWRDYTGKAAHETTGMGWVNVVHPDDVPTILGVWQDLLARGVGGDVEARVRRHDGVYRWCLFRSKPAFDAAGKPVRWYGITLDIDDSKQSQMKLAHLQKQLAQVARVTAVGEMTASITHEINQPLAAVLLSASTGVRSLERAQPDLENALVMLRNIQRDGKRMRDVITRLRGLFAKESVEHGLVDLNELVLEMVAFVRAEAQSQRVLVQTRLEGSLPRVLGDRVQLQQVLLNFVVNGIQAMTGVSTPRELVVVTRVEAGKVLLLVEDRGVGLREQDLTRVFEAFHTTKATGMGLGLSISRSIVEAHGGSIWAANNPTAGATFAFSLDVPV